MEIFPERLLADIERLPGAGHAYLKHIYSADGAELRTRLQRVSSRLGSPMDARAADLLGSFDNRRFFQGFAELVSVGLLHDARWRLRALHPPGPRIEMRGPNGQPFVLSVLAFLHQTRPGGEDASRARLIEELSRVRARDRFVVLIRRWLPHDFDPIPVRRAVEMWLGKVARNEWDGRYAAFEDDHVALEFALARQKAKGRQSPLADVIGPFFAHRTLEAIEPRVVQEIDRHNASPFRGRPLLLALVADQPWSLTPGYKRDFLYGRPDLVATGEGTAVHEFSEHGGVSVFRDPLYSNVSGLLFLDRDPRDPSFVRGEALVNPWARERLDASAFPVRTFAPDEAATTAARQARHRRAWAMRWYTPLARSWEIG